MSNTVRIRARPYVIGPTRTSFVVPAAGGGGGPLVLAFVSGDTPETSTINGSYNIGTAASDRNIMIALNAATNTSNMGTPTCVVNGVTLTHLVCATANTTPTYSAIFYDLVPSGSGSQNITITFPGTAPARITFGCYTITGTFNSITGGTDSTPGVTTQSVSFNQTSYAVVGSNIWAFTNDGVSNAPLINDVYRTVAAGVETMSVDHVTGQSGSHTYTYSAIGGGQTDSKTACACIIETL